MVAADRTPAEVERLVTQNTDLAYWMAWRLWRSTRIVRRRMSFAEAVDSAIFGLFLAARNWTPERARFSTTAATYCRNQILEDLRHGGSVSLPAKYYQQPDGRYDPVVDAESLPFWAQEQILWREQREEEGYDKDLIEKLLSCLNPRERSMVEGRFFLGLSTRQMGEQFGCSRTWVTEVIKRAIRKMRQLEAEVCSP